MTWLPDDAELDTLARTEPPAAPTPERVEDVRTRLLAAHETVPQVRRRALTPAIALGAIGVAAAAAIAVWIVARPPASTDDPRVSIIASDPAGWETTSRWPDYVVRLDDGKLTLQIGALGKGEHFRVVTRDGTIAASDTRFVVAADHGHIETIEVERGWVELAMPNEPAIQIKAGAAWNRVRMADASTAPRSATNASNANAANATNATNATTASAASTASDASGASNTSPGSTTSTTSTISTRSTTSAKFASAPNAATASKPPPAASNAAAASKASPSASNAPPAASKAPTGGEARITTTVPPMTGSAPRPGEADFRAGWAALRAGNASGAATSFAAACTAAGSDALGEDACFWAGASAKRAGKTADAKAQLTAFVRRFPSSARAAEASALLGWTLYDAGDVDAAEPYFQRAADDRVPSVRDSARRGLEAIARSRAR